MPLETALYIKDLVATNPLGSDQKLQGDDHIRLIKSVLQNTFPNLDAAVTATPELLNALGAGGSGTWPATTMRVLDGATSLNAISESGWWRYSSTSPQAPGGFNGFLLVLSSDGDLATPQSGRWVFQVAFAKALPGNVNTFGFNGGVAVRANFNGTGWTPWEPNWDETWPVGSQLIIWNTNIALTAGTHISPVQANVGGGGEPVTPAAYASLGGTWRILGSTGHTQVFPFPNPAYYGYLARRIL